MDESKCHQEGQQKTPWTPIETSSELCAFAALLTLMNDLVEKPPYEDYFKRNEQMWFHMPGFEKVFSKKPFNELKRYIYFSNPDAQVPARKDDNFDSLFNVRSFLERLTQNFHREYSCGREFSLDEAVVPFKGRLGIKQRIASNCCGC